MPSKKSAAASKKKVKKSKKTPKLNHLRKKIIGLVFLLLSLGLLTLFIFSIYSRFFPLHKPVDNKNPIKISSSLLSSKQKEDLPIRILIPKSDIDISVIPAKVVDGYWELSEHTASYGLGSGLPGTNGNIVIFAHARQGLFYNLKNVQIGDIIYVFTQNKWYRYKVNKVTAVYPNQTDVIQPTKKETLTLYTCTGFSDEKRLIVTATPQK